jgi:hypothetical protein
VDAGIGDVKTMLFNIFETLAGIHPRVLAPAQPIDLKAVQGENCKASDFLRDSP